MQIFIGHCRFQISHVLEQDDLAIFDADNSVYAAHVHPNSAIVEERTSKVILNIARLDQLTLGKWLKLRISRQA